MNDTVLLHGCLNACLWTLEVTALLIGALVLTRLMRGSASLRHLTCATAFCGLLLLPLVSVVSPTLVIVRTSAPLVAGDLLRSRTPEKWARAARRRLPVLTEVPVLNRVTRRVASGSRIGQGAEADGQARLFGVSVRRGLFFLWGAGFLFVAVRGALAFWSIGRLRRGSVPLTLDADCLDYLTTQTQLRRPWELRVSTTAASSLALTWGVTRPVVLLPMDAAGWPEERMEAVLLHELAHARRLDCFWQTLALIVCALYWFHPGVWLAAHALKADAEAAADDAVLHAGVKPSAYAEHLLWCAAARTARRQPMLAGMGLLRARGIEARIIGIIATDRTRRAATRGDWARVGLVALAATLTLASVRPAVSAGNSRDSVIAAAHSSALPWGRGRHLQERIMDRLRQNITPSRRARTNRDRRESTSVDGAPRSADRLRREGTGTRLSPDALSADVLPTSTLTPDARPTGRRSPDSVSPDERRDLP